MNDQYWDALATTYHDEVHDNLAADRHRVIMRRLDELASRAKTAADFGCGIGHYLRPLSTRFRLVHALDHSGRCLDRARDEHRDLKNIIYRKADLSQPLDDWKRASFGVCMNVLIAPDYALREAMVHTIHRALSPGADLLVLLPSLESALLTDVRLVEWNMRNGMTHPQAVGEGLRDEPGLLGPPAAGVVQCGGEPTKHYLREEAELMLRRGGFETLAVEKAEYSWTEEFEDTPRWMREPYPWHWVLTCKRD